MPGRTLIDSEAAWTAIDMADTQTWTHRLTAEQREEIAEAARAAHADGHNAATLTGEAFELPSLRADVAVWNRALTTGRGFVLLRDFPVAELTQAQVELAYTGLGHELGTPVSQNAAGDLLGHVRDEGLPRIDPSVRLYQTAQRQDFHTDGADIVGLLCLQKARTGGQSRIASAATVYNRILERRPDLLDVLYEPMFWDRNGEESPGEDPYFALPVLSDVAGTPRMFFIGWYIRDAQRHREVPRLTEAQLEAIELIETTANDPEVYLPMDFEPGDVQLLSNARILHCREAYVDHRDPEHRRHLLRLWLAAHAFTSVDDVLRGGIPAKKTD
jgi:Taurine catabolism dioxygenase TauD, TfdA family